jgi:hypothetical protein
MRVVGAIEQGWMDIDRLTAELQAAIKRFAAASGRASVSSHDGRLSSLLRSVQALGETLEELREGHGSLTVAAEALTTSITARGLLGELDATLRTLDPPMVPRFDHADLVVYPVVVGCRGSGASAKPTVDRRTVNSLRPRRIADEIVAATIDSAKSNEQFARSLYAAFEAVRPDAAGTISLQELYQVLAAAPPGRGSYTWDEFSVSLQHLRASDLRTAGPTIAFSFEVAAAGHHAVPVLEHSGDRVNIAYITFSQRTTTPNDNG